MKIIKVLMNGEQVAGAFTVDHALMKAQREAGGVKSARYVQRGDQLGYTGKYGFAYILKTEAMKIDEENSGDSRYPLAKDHSYHIDALDGTKLFGSVLGRTVLQVAVDLANNRKETVVIVSDASYTKKLFHPTSK